VNWRPLVLVILVIGLVAVGVHYVKKGASLPEGYQYEERPAGEGEVIASGETVPSAAVGTKTSAAPRANLKGMLEEEETFTYSSKNLRNPMTPLLAQADKVPTQKTDTRRASSAFVAHHLTGIMWSPRNPLAIIDGNVMSVGEKLRDGSLVSEIGRDFVALKRDGRTFRLVLE